MNRCKVIKAEMMDMEGGTAEPESPKESNTFLIYLI